MGVMPPQDNRSLGDLMAELSNETSRLVRKEVELATTEMTAKARVAAGHAGTAAAGGALMHAGLLVLLAAIVWCRRAPRAPGVLVLAPPDGSATIVATEIHFPNGCAITPEGELIVAESASHGGCLHGHDAHTVADDVVQLSGNPVALLRNCLECTLLAVRPPLLDVQPACPR
jgi:hypothetical protein